MVLTQATDIIGSVMSRTVKGQVNKPVGTAITKGMPVKLDTTNDNFVPVTAAAPAAGVFYVAIKDAAAADTKLLVAKKGPVCVTAGGAIGPHNPVTHAGVGGTAGRIVEAVAGSAGSFGNYMGKTNGNEHDGVVLVAAADGDTIWIDLNGGLGAGRGG